MSLPDENKIIRAKLADHEKRISDLEEVSAEDRTLDLSRDIRLATLDDARKIQEARIKNLDHAIHRITKRVQSRKK